VQLYRDKEVVGVLCAFFSLRRYPTTYYTDSNHNLLFFELFFFSFLLSFTDLILHFYVSKKALFSLPSRENPFPFFKGKDCSSEKQVLK
jgi:hypothetical protein